MKYVIFTYCFINSRTRPRTTDIQRELFFQRSWTFGLGQKYFEARLSAPILVLWVLCPCFQLFNHYFYKKLSLYIYPTFKWSGIRIWATKNLRFSFRVSLVRVLDHYNHLLHSKIVHALAIKVEKSNKSCKSTNQSVFAHLFLQSPHIL